MTILPAQSEDTQSQATAPAVRAPKKNVVAEGFRNHTKGEALFNKISYIGFGYFLTTAVSVAMTWLLNDKFAAGFGNFKTRIKEHKSLERFNLKDSHSFDSAMEIGTLFLGGTIASVFPVKWLEDSKRTLVKKFDHFYYTDEQIKNDPVIQQAYKTLDSEPKQTWLSVFSSRVVAFIATFTVFGLMGANNSPLAKATAAAESIDKRSIKAGRAIDKFFVGKGSAAAGDIEKAITANDRAIELGKSLPDTDRTKVFGPQALRDNTYGGADRIPSRVWNYIVKDAFYTAITSSTLFVFTRILGPVFGKKSKPVVNSAVSPSKAPALLIHAAAAESAEPLAAHTDTPSLHVSQTTHQQRVSAPAPSQEITA